MLYSRFVESRLFLSSLNAMNSLCRTAQHYDFADERWPLRSAYAVAYTCSRTFDPRPLDNLARVAGAYLVSSTTPLSDWDEFCLDYIMVAARLDKPACLTRHHDVQGRPGVLAAVRSASLAYFLGDTGLLAASTDRIRAANEHEFVWESRNAEALMSIHRQRQPDVRQLCRNLSDTPSELRTYCALDMYLLLRELDPNLRLRQG